MPAAKPTSPADILIGQQFKKLCKNTSQVAREWDINENTIRAWQRGVRPRYAADYLALSEVVRQQDLSVFKAIKAKMADEDYRTKYIEAETANKDLMRMLSESHQAINKLLGQLEQRINSLEGKT